MGSYAVKPFYYNYFGKKLIFGQSVDTMIRKDYRGNAFNLKKLSDEVYSALANDNISFVFGFPNKEIYLIRKKLLKWKDIGTLDIYLAPLSNQKVIYSLLLKISNYMILFYNMIINKFSHKEISEAFISKIIFSGDEIYRKKPQLLRYKAKQLLQSTLS